MALVADVRVSWVASPSTNVTRQVVVLTVDGTETTFDVDVGVDSWDTTLHANASCAVRIDSYGEGDAVPSETLEFAIPAGPGGPGGIEPASDLLEEITGWHDDAIGTAAVPGRGQQRQASSPQPARPQPKGARPAAARAAAAQPQGASGSQPRPSGTPEKSAGPPESVLGSRERK